MNGMSGKAWDYGSAEGFHEPGQDGGSGDGEAGQYPSVIRAGYRTGGGFGIRIEARLRNAKLIGAREMLGLKPIEAAKRIGVSYHYYLNCESMKVYPGRDSREKICDFYKSMGIDISEEEVFPEELRNLAPKRKYILEKTIPKSELLSLSNIDRRLLPVIESDAERNVYEMELKGEMQKALDRLNYREQQVIKMRFGFYGREMLLEDIAKEFDVTRERIRQIETKAIKKLRHPDRSKKLVSFLEL